MTDAQPAFPAEVELEDIMKLFSDSIGPDIEAINRFSFKEGPKVDSIISRLNELQGLLEGVTSMNQFENPAELTAKLQTLYSSIDVLSQFVAEVKRRVCLLDKEVDRQKPSVFGRLLKQKDSSPPTPPEEIVFQTDSLMELFGLTKQH